MKELKDYFVTKEQAVSLKELGFKDECLGYYRELGYSDGEFTTNSSYKDISTSAPLIAQAMDWLLDELGLLTMIAWYEYLIYSYPLIYVLLKWLLHIQSVQ